MFDIDDGDDKLNQNKKKKSRRQTFKSPSKRNRQRRSKRLRASKQLLAQDQSSTSLEN